MSILFNKHTIALLFFLFGFIHIEVFNQEKIPGLLLIVLGSIFAFIYTFNRKYILEKFDKELCVLLLFSIGFWLYTGVGVIPAAVFIIWLLTNAYYVYDIESKRKKRALKNDNIIQASLNKVSRLNSNTNFSSVKEEMLVNIENNYEPALTEVQNKYNQSKGNDKKRYKDGLDALNEEKEETAEDTVRILCRHIARLEADNSKLRANNFELQEKIKNLELIIEERNQEIKDLQSQISDNNRAIAEINQLLAQQKSNLSQSKAEIEQLNSQIANASGDKALISELENKLSAAENRYGLLDKKYQETLSEQNKLIDENEILKQKTQDLTSKNEEAMREKAAMSK